MKFKHTFNVFVDNFSITYKQLLYRLIIGVICGAIIFAGLSPFIRGLLNSDSLNRVLGGIKNFLISLLNGDINDLGSISHKIKEAYAEFLVLLETKTTQITLSIILLVAVYAVGKWFAGLGNYATAAVINDKMALRAESPFLSTLIKNLKEATLYNLIYVPLTIVYDALIGIAMFYFIFYLLKVFLPFFVCLFLFVVVIVVANAFKMTFTADWLPALIRGKMGQKASFVYTFARKGKNTMNVFSNFVILLLIIFGLNVAALICTLGVGMLITVPASFVIILSFELVNYYDREEIKYFEDKNSVVKPLKESTPTREEFFRGDED
ncbi:MAG: hypothetical protein HDP34_03840 [Clostridia bacterium]|nr:hypothetical protein [Clostridia bacterium]